MLNKWEKLLLDFRKKNVLKKGTGTYYIFFFYLLFLEYLNGLSWCCANEDSTSYTWYNFRPEVTERRVLTVNWLCVEILTLASTKFDTASNQSQALYPQLQWTQTVGGVTGSNQKRPNEMAMCSHAMCPRVAAAPYSQCRFNSLIH